MKFLPCCKKGDVAEDANQPGGGKRYKKLGGADRLPVAKYKPEWLDRPTNDFRVLTSHNTYLTGLQMGPGSCGAEGVK